MSNDASNREDVITKYKILAGVQGGLGAGLLICAILGTSFTQDDDQYFGPPYFIGGYLVGFLNLFSALLAGCVVAKGGDKDMSESKRSEVGCAITGHYIIGMFSLMTSFIGLIFAGVFGTNYDDDDHNLDGSTEDEARNVKIAYALIVGILASLCAAIFAMYLVCTHGKLFGVKITQGRRGRAVIVLNQTNPGALSAQTNNTGQMEQMRAQNLLLQQQIALQQQQMALQQQQQQQGFSGGQVYPPPPNYSSVVSDPAYPPPNPVFPSAPDPFKSY